MKKLIFSIALVAMLFNISSFCEDQGQEQLITHQETSSPPSETTLTDNSSEKKDTQKEVDPKEAGLLERIKVEFSRCPGEYIIATAITCVNIYVIYRSRRIFYRCICNRLPLPMPRHW